MQIKENIGISKLTKSFKITKKYKDRRINIVTSIGKQFSSLNVDLK